MISQQYVVAVTDCVPETNGSGGGAQVADDFKLFGLLSAWYAEAAYIIDASLGQRGNIVKDKSTSPPPHLNGI
jgi:hypothetical protein